MELNKTHKQYLNLLLIVAAIGFFVWLFFFIKNKIEEQKKKIKDLETNDLLNNNVVTNSSGVNVDLGGKAAEIYDSLHGSWFDEDEQRAIDVVKSTPKQSVVKLESVYFSLYGKNLKADLIKYVSSSDWKEISYQFS